VNTREPWESDPWTLTEDEPPEKDEDDPVPDEERPTFLGYTPEVPRLEAQRWACSTCGAIREQTEPGPPADGCWDCGGEFFKPA
jgi:hypothetical protein